MKLDDKLPLLGYSEIDDDHASFIKILVDIEQANKADFPAAFLRLYEHIKEHFERENALMEQYKYPAKDEHQADHHRVLGELTQLAQRIEQGRFMLGMAYVKDQLPRWFDLHVKTMDAALVGFILK